MNDALDILVYNYENRQAERAVNIKDIVNVHN